LPAAGYFEKRTSRALNNLKSIKSGLPLRAAGGGLRADIVSLRNVISFRNETMSAIVLRYHSQKIVR